MGANGDSTLNVAVKWDGETLTNTAYTTLIDTAAGINGGNLSPIAQGFNADATAQGSFTFGIDSATSGGAAVDFSALPDGLWSGEVNVEFVANWS